VKEKKGWRCLLRGVENSGKKCSERKDTMGLETCQLAISKNCEIGKVKGSSPRKPSLDKRRRSLYIGEITGSRMTKQVSEKK